MLDYKKSIKTMEVSKEEEVKLVNIGEALFQSLLKEDVNYKVLKWRLNTNREEKDGIGMTIHSKPMEDSKLLMMRQATVMRGVTLEQCEKFMFDEEKIRT